MRTSDTTALSGCLLVDVSMPEDGGIDLIRTMTTTNLGLSAIATATQFSPAKVVAAMKAGASDCLERPIADDVLVNVLRSVASEAAVVAKSIAYRTLAHQHVAALTARQRQILHLITLGYPSTNIAADLNISQRTVENHRAAIAKKTCSRSLSDVLHTAHCADCSLMRAWH
jgi:two-component system CheB/CheR fusion protein